MTQDAADGAPPRPIGPNEGFALEIGSDPKLLPLVRRTTEVASKLAGLDDTAMRQMTLAVDEAMSNVIRHACSAKPGHRIRLAFRFDERWLVIQIDHDGAPAPEGGPKGRDLDDVKPGGLGTHFINTAMDAVHYEQADDGCPRILMARDLHRSREESPSEDRDG